MAVLVGHACFLGMLTGDKAEMMGRRMMGEEIDRMIYIYIYDLCIDNRYLLLSDIYIYIYILVIIRILYRRYDIWIVIL